MTGLLFEYIHVLSSRYTPVGTFLEVHTSRKSKSIRVPGGSDPTACFAAPRTSTGTPG
eukprot:COSAG01_NODE_31369_length_598_cov_475.955912_1_plen_57_part_01